MTFNSQHIWCLCHQSWVNMLAHRLRSALAVLGLTIGSASVVALLYCSQLATLAVIKQLSALGTNLLSVSVIGQHEHNTMTLASLAILCKKMPSSEYAPVVYAFSGAMVKNCRLVVGSVSLCKLLPI